MVDKRSHRSHTIKDSCSSS